MEEESDIEKMVIEYMRQKITLAIQEEERRFWNRIAFGTGEGDAPTLPKIDLDKQEE